MAALEDELRPLHAMMAKGQLPSTGMKRKSGDSVDIDDVDYDKENAHAGPSQNKSVTAKKGKSTASAKKASNEGSAAKKQKTNAGQGKSAASKKDPTDFGDIQLPGEQHDETPVFDTPKEIRNKINTYLRKTGTTKAQLLRELNAQLKDSASSGLSGTSLNTFLQKKSVIGGATSVAFYAGYVFFEKQRLQEGKAKGKKREEMEKAWGKNGVDRSIDDSKGMFLHVTERASYDSCGILWIQPANGKPKKMSGAR